MDHRHLGLLQMVSGLLHATLLRDACQGTEVGRKFRTRRWHRPPAGLACCFLGASKPSIPRCRASEFALAGCSLGGGSNARGADALHLGVALFVHIAAVAMEPATTPSAVCLPPGSFGVVSCHRHSSPAAQGIAPLVVASYCCTAALCCKCGLLSVCVRERGVCGPHCSGSLWSLNRTIEGGIPQ